MTGTGTPYLRKLYSKIHRSGDPRGSNQFLRHGYSLLERPELCLIHYIGDESAFQPSTHGNKKHDQQNYTRTCPSVMKEIRENIESNSSGNVYKNGYQQS